VKEYFGKIGALIRELDFQPTFFFEALKKKKSKQIISLYVSMVLGMIAGIIGSAIVTRMLGKEQFGDLKFIQNLCSFVLAFLTFGLFYSGSRVIAQGSNMARKQKLIGAMTVIAVVISLGFSLILFFGSWLEEYIFKNSLGYVIRFFAPLMFIYPFELFCENMLTGDNKMYNLSVFRLGPKIAYLFSCLGWHYFILPLSVSSAFGLYLVSMAIFVLFAVYKLKPQFQDIKENIRVIFEENRSYGFPVFVGTLASIASTQLGGISIAYFIDNTNVGYFSLAVTATLPLTMIPSTVGTTFFKEFANLNEIPSKVINLTLILSLLALVGFMLLIRPLVILIYTREYLAVVPLTYYIAIGSTLQGYGDFYNRFISAHGRGNDLRNASFVIGIFNIVGYTVVVYFLGITGAAITKVLAGVVYMGMMYLSYRNFRVQTTTTNNK
jgi:O-antigen/teichoic acid export membrane protein